MRKPSHTCQGLGTSCSLDARELLRAGRPRRFAGSHISVDAGLRVPRLQRALSSPASTPRRPGVEHQKPRNFVEVGREVGE